MSVDLDTKSEQLTGIVTTDLTAITRGRFVAAPQTDERIDGVGWVPANLAINAFGAIFAENPWGSTGDLRLIPDPAARYMSGATGSSTPFDIMIGNLANMDGSPWEGCTRSLLINAVEVFRARTGLSLSASFEHEFLLLGGAPAEEHGFSLSAFRRRDPYGPRLMRALSEAGVEPEVVLSEYGDNQFEVTYSPTNSLRAADRAIAVRELAREIARNLGWRASFAPKATPAGVGTGVHVHFSFWDSANRPATYDPSNPAGLSIHAGSFCAGVLAHLPGMVAITAPSVPSFYRLQPHHWSSAWTWLAERDREATLRICPGFAGTHGDLSNQYNVEYRAADGIANPYLTLAALIHAGLDGIERGLRPTIVSRDPAVLSDSERERYGLQRLPSTFEDALNALERDDVLAKFMGPALLKTYLGVKRSEILEVQNLDPAEICARYLARY